MYSYSSFLEHNIFPNLHEYEQNPRGDGADQLVLERMAMDMGFF